MTDHQIVEADTVAPGPVPGQVQLGEDLLTIERAWPRGRRDGAELMLVEGRDGDGRLRAARLWLQPAAGLRWQVSKVQVAPAGMDPKLPELGAVCAEGTLLVHRYGRRAVVRRRDDFVKVVRPGEGSTVAAAAQLGRDLALAAGFDAPTVGAIRSGSVSFGILPGRSLHELGGVLTRSEWTRWWAIFAERWAALAQPPAAGRSQSVPDPHGPHDEVAVLRRWLDWVTRLEALPADLHDRVAERVEIVARELVGTPAEELVLAHRDLHDKQMLAEGDSLGLLDFDTVALAEPALDLANLWVHARLRADQGVWSSGHSEVAQDAVREVASTLGVSGERFATYAEATALRLACLYAFRPRHRQLALDWAAGQRFPAV
ncbi:phosphotransferase [Ornithinimicrobium faecis]|uniref:Phosphotransferase n=1 Tax=Ornithinimicrobium faecis TaxID=2934158 RepID=A0ABY4YYY6_9MICO|nr:phosphotransferase [Ornithinimicrobium sp. HY1793]USQ81967.1 phosphotransferase [Ornithinimicrobium sp. HY1793]